MVASLVMELDVISSESTSVCLLFLLFEYRLVGLRL